MSGYTPADHDDDNGFELPLIELKKDVKQSARTLSFRDARWFVDTYYTLQDQRIRSGHQLKQQVKIQEPHRLTDWVAEGMEKFEQLSLTALNEFAKSYSVGLWLQSQFGIGPVLSAALLSMFDIRKAPKAGQFNRFAGVDPTLKWLGKKGSKDLLESIFGSSKKRASQNKTYEGRPGGVTTNTGHHLDPRVDLKDYLAGFNWGQNDGGAKQLAFAILCDHLNDTDFAEAYHEQFAADVIAELNGDKPFHLTSRQIERWYRQQDGINVIGPLAASKISKATGQHPVKVLGIYNNGFKLKDKEYKGLEGVRVWLSMRPWNARLKAIVVYRMGSCFIKTCNKPQAFYGQLYKVKKQQLLEENEAGKFKPWADMELATRGAKMKKTERYKYWLQGQLSPDHILARARRWTAQIMLSHLHKVMYYDYHRQLPERPFVFSLPNHSHEILPVNFNPTDWPRPFEKGRSLKHLYGEA